MPKAAPAEPVQLRKIKIGESRVQRAEYIHTTYSITPEGGTTFAELLAPEVWAHVAGKFRPHDFLDVIPEDGTFYARFIVLSADRLWAKVHPVLHIDLTTARKDMPLTDDQNHEVIWKGALSKYAVIRKSDQEMLKDGFNTPLEGWTWLTGHLKSLAA